MTRLAVLSDIHGNLPALHAVLADLAQFKVDQIIVPGDVVNWGPFSAQVLERVTREGWPVVRGNNEFYLLDYNTPRAPVEWNDDGRFPMLPWLHRQLNGHWQNVIAGWRDSLSMQFPDAPPIRVFHGSPRDNTEPIYPITPAPEIETLLAGIDETTIIAGHTHLIMDRQVGRWHILNAGSVGVPVDGILTASYMLLDGNAEGWRASWRRVPFDYAPVFEEFARQRFVDECGLVGRIVVEEFKTARLHLTPFLNWRNANCPDAPFELSLFDEFSQADRWAYTPLAYHVNV